MEGYVEYRDSGIPWIGNVPSHWEIVRLQTQLDEVNEKNDPVQTTQILSLTNKLGVIPYEEKGNQGNKSKEDLSTYKIAYPDCIVANSMNILIGSVGLSKYHGCVSPVYYVFRAKNAANIDYLNYLFSLPSFQRELRKYANGILEIRLRVSSSNILKRKIALPPVDEQREIVEYLKSKIERIDSVIAEAKASIEEYKVWKASIIYEAVTKGLDPNAEMKDSGVEWIGMMPTTWSACALKHLTTKIGSGKTPSGGAEVYTTEGVMFLRSQNVYNTGLELDSVSFISEEIDETMANTRVQYQDVLLNITGGSIGRCCLYDLEGVPANVNQHVCILRADKTKLLPQFLRYFWNSSSGPMVVAQHQTGGNRQGLNFEQIGSTKIPCCSIEEQAQIVSFLDNRCQCIDMLVNEKESLISDLEAYKKALIFEVVTGKRRVC